MPTTSYVYCDANVFLAYFNAEAGRVEKIDPLFEAIQKDNLRKLITSVVSITEVSHVAEEKHKNKLNATIYNALENFWGDSSLIEFVEVNERIARDARNLIRTAISQGYSLRTNDALHLISAQFAGVREFFTYDQKLIKFGPILDFDVTEPFNQSPQLPLDFDNNGG